MTSVKKIPSPFRGLNPVESKRVQELLVQANLSDVRELLKQKEREEFFASVLNIEAVPVQEYHRDKRDSGALYVPSEVRPIEYDIVRCRGDRDYNLIGTVRPELLQGLEEDERREFLECLSSTLQRMFYENETNTFHVGERFLSSKWLDEGKFCVNARVYSRAKNPELEELYETLHKAQDYRNRIPEAKVEAAKEQLRAILEPSLTANTQALMDYVAELNKKCSAGKQMSPP